MNLKEGVLVAKGGCRKTHKEGGGHRRTLAREEHDGQELYRLYLARSWINSGARGYTVRVNCWDNALLEKKAPGVWRSADPKIDKPAITTTSQ